MGTGSGRLPFDPADPPADPPEGCRNRLLWQLARRVFGDHQPGPDGFCLVCRPYQFYPCVGRQLADTGLRACYDESDGAPWRCAMAGGPPRGGNERGWRPWA